MSFIALYCVVGAAFNSSNTFKVSGSESQDQSDWNPSTLFTSQYLC